MAQPNLNPKNMTAKMIVAIDGPAGSGKSSIAIALAKRLKIPYIDTGAMYRALTYLCLCHEISLKDDDAIEKIAKNSKIILKRSSRGETLVLIDGLDVTRQIRKPELTQKVHFIASNAGARKAMVSLQRKMGKASGGVIEGRDIGSIVFPNTPFKFYLDADIAIRAKRRFHELKAKGEKVKLKDILAAQKLRDKRDMSRKLSPLTVAPGATLLDTSTLTIRQVVGKIAKLISGKRSNLQGVGQK